MHSSLYDDDVIGVWKDEMRTLFNTKRNEELRCFAYGERFGKRTGY